MISDNSAENGRQSAFPLLYSPGNPGTEQTAIAHPRKPRRGNFVRKAEVLTSEKWKSKVPQTGSQDFQKTASNNTEINNTDLNETDPSIYPVRGLPEDRPPAAADEMDTMEAYREVIKENIEYDIMRQQLGYNRHLRYLLHRLEVPP